VKSSPPSKSKYVGKKLSDINFRHFYVTLIAAIRRSNNAFHFNPDRESWVIEENDALVIIGHHSDIGELAHEIFKV